MQLYLTVRPEDTRTASAYPAGLAHAAYRIGEGSSLLSRNPPKNEVLPYKLIPSLKDTKSFTKKPLFLERLFEWEFWWVEGNRATAGKNKGSSRFFVG